MNWIENRFTVCKHGKKTAIKCFENTPANDLSKSCNSVRSTVPLSVYVLVHDTDTRYMSIDLLISCLYCVYCSFSMSSSKRSLSLVDMISICDYYLNVWLNYYTFFGDVVIERTVSQTYHKSTKYDHIIRL